MNVYVVECLMLLSCCLCLFSYPFTTATAALAALPTPTLPLPLFPALPLDWGSSLNPASASWWMWPNGPFSAWWGLRSSLQYGKHACLERLLMRPSTSPMMMRWEANRKEGCGSVLIMQRKINADFSRWWCKQNELVHAVVRVNRGPCCISGNKFSSCQAQSTMDVNVKCYHEAFITGHLH